MIDLARAIKEEAARQGFLLCGITTPDPPPHLAAFTQWLADGRHASMQYLAEDRSIARRSDPRLILPDCKAILVLGIPYADPRSIPPDPNRGRVAAYAWGDDYHLVLPNRLKAIIQFIEAKVEHPVVNRWYTDTGAILERDLAQRAGLGWIGKNSCLINPRRGSYFFLAEILLDLDLPIDQPFTTDHCGTCTRCIDACPTQAIKNDRMLDARQCISFLTIENKNEIPAHLQASIGNWVFGCDICQTVCPWNRFAGEPDPAFAPRENIPSPNLIEEINLTPQDFNKKFKDSPVQRAKHRGYLRNVEAVRNNER